MPSFVCLVGGKGRVPGWGSVLCRKRKHGKEHMHTIILHKSGATHASTNRQMNNQYINILIMEYHTALKKQILTHATTWMTLEDLMLSDISQTQNDKYSMAFTRQPEQIHGDKKDSHCQGVGEGRIGGYCSVDIGFQFGKMEKSLEMDGGYCCTTTRRDFILQNWKNG